MFFFTLFVLPRVESIQKGFMKLVTLDEMNGAILYASERRATFRSMKHLNLGELWPVKKNIKAKL